MFESKDYIIYFKLYYIVHMYEFEKEKQMHLGLLGNSLD